MTREIESTFEYEGKTYKVVQDEPKSVCAECAFLNEDCEDIEEYSGDCIDIKRTDRELVHFELVTKE